MVNVLWIGDYIIDSTRHLHDAEAVLKPPVRCCRIHQISQRKLVNVAKTLEGLRANDLRFVRSEPHKNMNWIANLTHATSQVNLRLLLVDNEGSA